MKKLSQRDSRWSNKKLGTSSLTIGGYGCTITALTMLANLFDVGDVNERLKAVNGFSNGSLLIWSKINEALPWLTFQWRGYSYDNNKVKKAIEDNGGCLVEVDGKPIGGDKHWVLYIGDSKMIDPWDGKEKSTATYTATGYSIIRNDGNNGSSEPESDIMEIDKATFEKLVKNSSAFDEFVKAGYQNAQQVIDEKAELEKKISDYEKKNEELDKANFNLKEDLRTCQTALAACQTQLETAPSVEEDFEVTGRKTIEVQNGVTVETTYKVKETI